MMLQAQATSIFTNDLAGYVKLFLAIVAGNAAVGSLVGYWIKNKSDSAIAALTEALNGVGRRVSDIETENGLNTAWRTEQHTQKARDDAKFQNLSERLSKQEAAMERLEKDLHEHHKEQRDLILASAEKQVEATHKLELQIVSLKEQSTLGDCIVEMGKSMEKAFMAVRREAQR